MEPKYTQEYFKECGRRGGKVRSQKKVEAAKKRWERYYGKMDNGAIQGPGHNLQECEKDGTHEPRRT